MLRKKNKIYFFLIEMGTNLTGTNIIYEKRDSDKMVIYRKKTESGYL